MREFFRRLLNSRRLAAEICAASFFANLLSLALPIFVIQILSRYIGYGFDGTLVTLTSGMLLALALGHGFNSIRFKMASALSAAHDQLLHEHIQAALADASLESLNVYSHSELHEIASGPRLVQAAYAPSRVIAILDMPFFLLFILAIYLFSPLLALITLIAVVATIMLSFIHRERAQKSDETMRKATIAYRGSVAVALSGKEEVRAFLGGRYLKKLWKQQQQAIEAVRKDVVNRQGKSKALLQTLASLLRVAVYAVGAKLVVGGELSVGALIGVSILASKAFMITNSFTQAYQMLGMADSMNRRLHEFTEVPVEPSTGTTLPDYSGRLTFQDVSFSYPSNTTPLFESLDMTLEPGTIIAINGYNGSGKSTLVKLIAGLLQPSRGSILADGVDLRQLVTPWWRRRLCYLPQEPTFLNGSYRENITTLASDIREEGLNSAIAAADLKRHLDLSPTGLETMITDGGATLPVGIRKRLALARALVGQGELILFDEPTEGLDMEGCHAVYAALNRFIQDKKTIVVVSRDQQILNAAQMIIDLSQKPCPAVCNTPRSVSGQQRSGGGGAG